MSEFKREERFIVVKRKHIANVELERKLRHVIEYDCGAPTIECVVVESDWPEYETVWAMIQARAEGRPNELTAANERIRELELLLTAQKQEWEKAYEIGVTCKHQLTVEREVSDKLVDALADILSSHAALVNSGDCGNWDVENEAEVIQARAAIAAVAAIRKGETA